MLKKKIEFWLLKGLSSFVLSISVISISQCCSGRLYQVGVGETLKEQIKERAKQS